MQLLIVRHAIAEEREVFAASGGSDDDLRPLTKEGQRKMERVARGLACVVSQLDVLGTSPLVRARETAAIISEAYGEMPITEVTALRPESAPGTFLRWLQKQRSAEVVAVVGHEPSLGMLATWLMTGLEESRMTFRKGGACLLEFAASPKAGAGNLQWLLTPSQLRRIGG